jgi:TRAP transporter TAXI family solute receptor
MTPHPFRRYWQNVAWLSRRDRVWLGALVFILVAVVVWAVVQFVQSKPAHRVVLASGPESGVYHRYALRYMEILGREGVVVEERITGGAVDNLRLLLDPNSGVDVAFLQAGIATSPASDGLVMLASLYYEPLWIFYRDSATISKINQLHGKSMAVGVPGSGTLAFAEQILAANGIQQNDGSTGDSTHYVPIGGNEALAALNAGNVEAALFVGGAQAPAIQRALRDPGIKFLSLDDAAAYPRRFPYITKLTLPPGTIDLAGNLPDREVNMIGTKAMLATREDFRPALINLLIDAARDIHGEQGYFEAAGEFPSTAPVDLRVSPQADQHKRFGPSFLYRYLPFWVATFVERAIILLVPLVVILVPVASLLPNVVRWRVRSRIYRWYGELALLERDVAMSKDKPPIERWLQDVDRIKLAVQGLRTPSSFASEAYTLRTHVGMVRSMVLAKRSEGIAVADEVAATT